MAVRGVGGWRFPEAMSQQDVAVLLGVSRTAVQKMQEQGLPRAADGSYDLRLVVRWYEERAERRGRNSAAAEASAAVEAGQSPALERKRTAEAMRAELELAREAGEVVSLSYVEEQFTRALRVWQDALRTLPQVCLAAVRGRPEIEQMPALVGVRDVLERQVREALWGLDDVEEGVAVAGAGVSDVVVDVPVGRMARRGVGDDRVLS